MQFYFLFIITLLFFTFSETFRPPFSYIIYNCCLSYYILCNKMDLFAYSISNIIDNLDLGFLYWRYEVKCNSAGWKPMPMSRVAYLTGIDRGFLSKVKRDLASISLKNFKKVYNCLYADLVAKKLI